jgi:hypothetical protein
VVIANDTTSVAATVTHRFRSPATTVAGDTGSPQGKNSMGRPVRATLVSSFVMNLSIAS